MQIGEIYKVKDDDGEYYVEVKQTPEYLKLKPNQAYVCTRTPYTTSMMCQIETAGVIDVKHLLPLDNRKDKEMLKRITQVQKKNKLTMQFYATELPNGTFHVQNYMAGLKGQHHVHDKASFEKWSKDIEPETLHLSKAETCMCNLSQSGDTTEYDGHTWQTESDHIFVNCPSCMKKTEAKKFMQENPKGAFNP